MTIALKVLLFAYFFRFVLGVCWQQSSNILKDCKLFFYDLLNRFRGCGRYCRATLLKTSPACKRVFKCWSTLTSFAARKTFPVAASIVME